MQLSLKHQPFNREQRMAMIACAIGVVLLSLTSLILDWVVPMIGALWLLVWVANKFDNAKTVRLIVFSVALAVIMFVFLSPGLSASAQTAIPPPDIEIDVTPLFSNLGVYIALFMGILALPGAIKIGKQLVVFIIDMIVDAF